MCVLWIYSSHNNNLFSFLLFAGNVLSGRSQSSSRGDRSVADCARRDLRHERPRWNPMYCYSLRCWPGQVTFNSIKLKHVHAHWLTGVFEMYILLQSACACGHCSDWIRHGCNLCCNFYSREKVWSCLTLCKKTVLLTAAIFALFLLYFCFILSQTRSHQHRAAELFGIIQASAQAWRQEVHNHVRRLYSSNFTWALGTVTCNWPQLAVEDLNLFSG